MELQLSIIAAALVGQFVLRLLELVRGIRRDRLLTVLGEQQQRLVDSQQADAERMQHNMRALLIAGGCSPERADELLDKSPAEILSLVPDHES